MAYDHELARLNAVTADIVHAIAASCKALADLRATAATAPAAARADLAEAIRDAEASLAYWRTRTVTIDEGKSDETLQSELAAIDASLRQDRAPVLSAALARLGHRRELLDLVDDHQAAVKARRAVVVDLLSDAALPKRLAAFDRLLERERDRLAAKREAYTALPGPVASDSALTQELARIDQGLIRQDIDDLLRAIGYLAADRAPLVARMKARPGPGKTASEKRFLAPWSGLSLAPLGW